jgi:zinc transport system substrate-binding protein
MARRTFLIAGIAFFAGLAVVSLGCGRGSNPWAGKGGPPRIVVTLPAYYSFARSVAGEDAGVVCLCTHTGPHEYPYNPQDSMLLKRADLFLANGLALEPFADRLAETTSNRHLSYVKLAESLPANLLQEPGPEGASCCDPDDKDAGHGNHEHATGRDPHVWLGVPQAIEIVAQIRDQLKEKDPTHADAYGRRAAEYTARLHQLQVDGKAMLKGKKNDLVAFHDALGYFATSFGLDVAGVLEMQPGVEPSATQMAQLVGLCKKKQVSVIVVEPQYPQHSVAKTLLDRLRQRDGVPNAAFVVVDPLETADPSDLDAGWYERKMRENLANLAEKLPHE